MFSQQTKCETECQSSSRWKAPAVGLYKINVDGIFNHITRKGSCGFVVRDSTGTMIAGGGRPLSGLFLAEHAEALACEFAFAFALNQNLVPTIVEIDSQLVQQQLCRHNGSNWSLLTCLDFFMWIWVIL
ncbi:putative ribonuclease H-like domain-containing protein [Rosa chinensis]|uniref:Putative ribonuclease H-like domain-containing protein n=1 Tax=Rosa chinensis TaxID=74649 RepID=A0A2P6P5C1_ROSCH|nr:putative ribonuclease H-like domain-containing protein [Rosa chinensis]